jgi:hypothetical protein
MSQVVFNLGWVIYARRVTRFERRPVAGSTLEYWLRTRTSGL